LATITTEAENAWIWDNLGQPDRFRLGGFQPPGSPEPDGGWQWVTDEPWDYENWSANQPSNANGDESTLEFIHVIHGEGEWNDVSDSGECLGYIVEYDYLVPSEPLLWPTHEGGNSHRYRAVIVSGGCTWSEAVAAAESSTWEGVPGHLATIQSSGENAWIWDNLGQPDRFRLGGFQPPGSPEPDGGWQWITGEPWDYENWSANQPSNANGDESTLEFIHITHGAGEWNDVNENGDCLGYIVEYPSGPAPVRATTWGRVKAMFK